MKSHRLARVSEVVREVAAKTILFELRDPRVKMVTVTRAEVTADLQHATIFVSVMGSEREQNLVLHGLESAAGFIQARLAEQLQTRYTPVVQFKADPGVKNSLEIARLLKEEAARAPGGAESPPEEVDAEGPADE